MGAMEIIILVFGVVVFIVSFLLPAGKKEDQENTAKISEETIRKMVGKEVDDAKEKVDDIINETITYSMEKAERSMERLTNEKMLAVNEYSDTVLAEINKNHKEVVFLYDMLNEKQDNLKATVSEATKTAGEIKQTVKDAEITAKEVEAKAKEVQQTVNEMVSSAAKAIEAAPAAARELPDGSSETLANDAPGKEREEDFRPIVAKKIRVLQSPEPDSQEEKDSKGTGKAPRKPRAPRNAKKDGKTQKKDLPEEALPLEVPEVAVSLNEEGMTGGRNNNERILELHGAGKSNMAIARELGLGIGEVKLVIDLFEGI